MKYSPKEAERLILNAVERTEPGLFCGNMGLALRYFDFAYHAESDALRNILSAICWIFLIDGFKREIAAKFVVFVENAEIWRKITVSKVEKYGLA